MDASDLKSELRRAASAERASASAWFFKTGKGEYGEGDKFLGVSMPEQRKIAGGYFKARPAPACRETLAVVRDLLRSEFHEDRMTALLILVACYKRSGAGDRQRIFDFYMKNLKHINNWDLVDSSAPYIVGVHLLDKDASVLSSLAESENLWARRVAVLATAPFIREGRFSEILHLAERLLIEKKDSHDLMHKSVGWMLREVGKQDRAVLEAFLDRFGACLPRTALRYAIERFPEAQRLTYLHAPSSSLLKKEDGGKSGQG